MSGVRGMPLPDDELEPCGTLAAYRRHLRRGDPVDRDCQQAVTRDWQDRVAAGWERPPRQYRKRVHLAGVGGAALCGKRARAAVTSDPGDATCRFCVAVLRRHRADADRSASRKAAA